MFVVLHRFNYRLINTTAATAIYGFAAINVSQVSIAICARWGGIFDIHLTANLPRNLAEKKTLNHLRVDGIMVTSLCPRFLAHPVG